MYVNFFQVVVEKKDVELLFNCLYCFGDFHHD